METVRRQAIAARLARRSWNAREGELPLGDTFHEIDLRRRRAQISARRALEIHLPREKSRTPSKESAHDTTSNH